jgi:hypothetical protein
VFALLGGRARVLEVGAVAAAAGGVDLFARRFDLDHVGTPIGELAHRGPPGAMRGQIDYEQIFEGQSRLRHRPLFRLPAATIAALGRRCPTRSRLRPTPQSAKYGKTMCI